MSGKLPPSPVGMHPGHSFWNDWYEKIRDVINNTLINHNDLLNIQGGSSGEYYHLTNTQRTRVISVVSKAGVPTTSDIASGQWAVYKDTSGGTVRLWANDGGTMKSVTLT